MSAPLLGNWRTIAGVNQNAILVLFETHLTLTVDRVAEALDLSYSDARIALMRLHQRDTISRVRRVLPDKRGYRRPIYEYYLKPWQRAWLEGAYIP